MINVTEVLAAVRMMILFFWVVGWVLSFSPEDGDSMFIRNIGIYL
jgi:hypothetical protein